MAAPLKYNPLLKRCLQETADTSQIESDISDIKTLLNSLTKDNNGNYVVSIPTKFLDNVTVEGTQTVVKTQELQSENDYIVLRAGNPLGLAPGAYSGFRIANYDGNNNNCLLVVDADGWARIGDESGTVQKIATIEENPTNGALVAYNTTTKQLESQNMSLSDFVKKFTDSEGAILGNNEIGQYQGETTADLQNGYFYKKSNTIPANTWYFQIENDVYVDNTKLINKGLYTYDNSSIFNVTTDYVDKRTNGGQPMLFFVKNPVVGVGAIKRNMSTNTITNVVITDITGDNITVNDGSVFNDTVENSSYGVMDKFVNENGDVVFIPFTQTEGEVIDGSTILSIVISVINNTYNCYAPYPSPITIHKSNGSQGGNLTQTDAQPQPPVASANNLGLIKVGSNLAINADGVLSGNYQPAATTAAGLMSATDKTKLNGIAQGAQVNPTATAVASYSGANGVSIKAVKYGRIVSLFVTSATTNTVSITLASQFKPLNQFLTGLYWNSNNSITVNVGTDGVAKVSGLWNTSQGNFMCTYFSAS